MRCTSTHNVVTHSFSEVPPSVAQEVTRRVQLRDIWQACYTAGVVLPKPLAECQYWHRTLNPRKLISVGFSRLQVCVGPWMCVVRYSTVRYGTVWCGMVRYGTVLYGMVRSGAVQC